MSHGSVYHRYSPITRAGEIRLVTINGAEPGMDICCSVRHASIENDYTAISYTWGTTTSSMSIVCDGKQLHVSPNCYELLQSLWNAKAQGPFWIDAISINQEDIAERNHQVDQMGNIYNGASRTILYLGLHDEHSSHLFEQFAHLQEHAMQLMARKAEYHLIVERALRHFFSRPWFSRTWVIQELLLSRDARILVGSTFLDYDRRRGATTTGDDTSLKLLSRLAAYCNVPTPALFKIYEQLKGSFFTADRHAAAMASNWQRQFAGGSWAGGSRQTWEPTYSSSGLFTSETSGRLVVHLHRLLEVLELARDSECQDPRDKIFAIESLFPSPMPKLLRPDYSKDLIEVYTDATWFLIDYDTCEALGTIEADDTRSEGMPSWVNDWRCISTTQVLRSETWAAGWTDGHRQIVAKRQHKTLIITGVRLGTVVEVSSPASQNKTQQLSQWQGELRTPGRLTMLDLFDDSIGHVIDRSTRATILMNRLRLLKNRRVIVLDSGRQGLGPPDTRTDDVVSVFLGMPTPFVLRPQPHGTGWHLVGRCTTSGYMHGEAVRNVDWSAIDREVAAGFLEEFHIE